MAADSPKVFVCSTVYDFRDLRSALRMWLEEFGYEVLMSELNDFPQIAGENSYDSCLQAINQSDYFILLIGGRVGGWFDRAKRVSITRMEYQHAYERFKQGKLKLLVFVRKEIWDVREDRQALKKFLEASDDIMAELRTDAATRIVNHPSKFMNDAEFVIDFLQEVGRVEEMKDASSGAGVFPGGNWIYQFASFREIIGAVRSTLNISGNLRRNALAANLRYEIKTILSELLESSGNRVWFVTDRSRGARARFKGKMGDSSTYTGQNLVSLGIFLLCWGNVGMRLPIAAIWEAITSGEFLEFDMTSGTHSVGPLQRALFALAAHIDRLRKIDASTVREPTIALLSTELKSNREREFTKRNAELV